MTKNQDRCPKCGSEDLIWGPVDIQDDWGLYPATCEKCGFEGNQCFDLVFQVWQDINDSELNEWKNNG